MRNVLDGPQLDDNLTFVVRLGEGGGVTGIGLHRNRSEPRFTRRERQILDVLAAELAPDILRAAVESR